MKKYILIICFCINIATLAENLEFRGIAIKKKIGYSVQYNTRINDKNFSTTITYKGENKNKEFIIEISENQDSKNHYKSNLTLKSSDKIKINGVEFRFINWGNVIYFLKT